MRSWKYAAAAAVLAATPLAAQDAPQQTVEGAQEFLRLITTQFSMSNSALTSGESYFTYRNIRFEPESACTSTISSELTWRVSGEQSIPAAGNEQNFEGYKAVLLRGSQMDATALANWHKAFEGNRFRTSVDWSSVSSIETYSAKPYGAPDDVKRVIIVHAQPAFALVAPDVALATRIAYAMEFLRAACDRSAETGF